MATNKERLIAELVGNDKEPDEIDKSLRGRAYQRATDETLPKTMTPWEWEEWYDMHGTPEEHRNAAAADSNSPSIKNTSKSPTPASWWKRLFSRKQKPDQPKRNCSRSPSEDAEF